MDTNTHRAALRGSRGMPKYAPGSLCEAADADTGEDEKAAERRWHRARLQYALCPRNGGAREATCASIERCVVWAWAAA